MSLIDAYRAQVHGPQNVQNKLPTQWGEVALGIREPGACKFSMMLNSRDVHWALPPQCSRHLHNKGHNQRVPVGK